MNLNQRKFEAETTRLINDAKISALASFCFADDHQGHWPTSFAQLNEYHPVGTKNGIPALESRLLDSGWEFVSGGNRASFADLTQTILFREGQPRRSPDGTFVRIYAFTDHSIQVLTSPIDDFAFLEKQRHYLIHPTTN